jgi:hypothetical protein
MDYSSGGWTLVFHGLPSEAMVLDTTNESVKLSNNIIFNDIRMEGVNLNFDVTTTAQETAQLSKTIPQYFYEVDQASDGSSPRVNFHDIDGNQDVQLSSNYFMFGYGNSWRVFYTCINVAEIDYLYIGGYSPSCTPRSSFISTDVGCSTGGNYCLNSRTTTPVDSGLGLSLYEYQETKVWVRENDITLNINQSSASSGEEEQSPGPVAYWKFDEGTGTTANDSTGRGNDGTLTNGPTWQTEDVCISGKCLEFNGDNSYIDITNDGVLNFGGRSFTISMWLKNEWDGVTGSNSLIGTGNPYNDGGKGWILYQTDLDSIKLRTRSTGDVLLDRSWTTSFSGSWDHLVFLIDYDEGRAFLYLNGDLIEEFIVSSMQTDFGTSAIRIGNYGNAPGSDHGFDGLIDEVKIYPYARTADQIKADYNSRGSSGTSSQIAGQGLGESFSNGLVGYWKMDENNGTSINDSSGNNQTGSFVNSPEWLAGKYGSGVNFVSTTGSHYIRVDNSTYLNPANTFTVGFWVNFDNQWGSWDIVLGTGRWENEGGWHFGTWSSDSPGKISFHTASYAARNTSTTGTIDLDDQWHYIIGTYDNGIAKIYIDGVLKDSDSSIPYESNSNKLIFGAGNNSDSPTYEFWGSIDEVRLYNRALSAEEVIDLYNWSPGPVGYWKLDENSGIYAEDSSGNSNKGTLTNSPTWVKGKIGGAVSLMGDTDYINVVGNDALDNIRGITISTWVNFDEFRDNAYENIVIKQTSKDSGGCGYQYGLTGHYSAQNIRFFLDTTGGSLCQGLISNSTLEPGRWYHVAGTYDPGSGSVKIYIDGILDKTGTYSGEIEEDGVYDLRMGMSNVDFDGQIDDVKIYNYARTQKQIIEDMNAGRPVVNSPIAHWKLDEGQGDTVYDSIGGSNGTISGATWTNEGKFGKALSFDGTNNYVAINFSSMKQIISFSWWANISSWTNARFISSLDYSPSPYGFSNRVTNSTTFSISGGSSASGRNANITIPALSLNTWYHFVTYYDIANNSFHLYIDGKYIGNTGTLSWSIDGYSDKMVIGRWATDYGNYYYTGLIDEAKIYNFALTPEEILQDYNQGKATVMGALGTDSSGNPSFSASAEYCIPGDTATCDPPVARWDFEEGSGGTAYDKSGNEKNLTLTNTSWSNGKIGKGLKYDGSSSTAYVLDGPSISLTNTGTLEAWVYSNRNYPSDDGNTKYRNIINKWTGGSCSGTDEGYSLDWYGTNTTGNLRGIICNGSSAQGIVTSYNFTPNVWNHVAYVWDGSYHRLYVNGSLLGSPVSQTVNNQDDSSTLRIGDGFGSGADYRWDGMIDEVRIYNYARTPAQVAWDYNRGAPVAHWKFNECQGTTAYDVSGNDNHGTVTIGATEPQTSAGTCADGLSTSAWYNGRNGKYGGSLSFDGVDDWINVSQPDIQTSPNFFTVSGWINPDSHDSYFITPNSVGLDQWIGYVNNERIYIYVAESADTNQRGRYSAVGSVPVGIWTHWAISVNDKNIKIYINGKLDSEYNEDIDIAGWTGDWRIGQRGNSTHWFSGQLDDLRVYNYILTAEQIKLLYNENSAVRFGD